MWKKPESTKPPYHALIPDYTPDPLNRNEIKLQKHLKYEMAHTTNDKSIDFSPMKRT